MPTQLQLEGPDLESLLARVRAEHGAGARIVRAEKVRTGGVGGFFAKQTYEIGVEIDEATTPTPAPGALSLLDLADQVSASERSAAAVSTESTGFAAVLAGLGAAAGEAAPAAAPPAPERPAAGAVVVPRQRQASPPAPAPAPEQRPAVERPAVQRPTVERPPARTVRPRADVAVRPGSAEGVVVVRANAARAGTAVSVRPPGTVAVPRRTSTTPVTGALAAAARRPSGAALSVQAQLTGLGLPEHLLPAAPGDRLHKALVEVLAQLPRAPRTSNRAGSVLAVVGPLPLALGAARQTARELGLPVRSSVAVATAATTCDGVASTSLLRDPEAVRRRRDSWRRRKSTTILVVDAPLTAAGAVRAREHLDALEPTATWCVVEATRKAHDVGAWTRAVGRVDALALTAVEETADPASVLALGIPVGRLGSRRATPAAWAALLTDRLAA